jgi:hypothetical protein
MHPGGRGWLDGYGDLNGRTCAWRVDVADQVNGDTGAVPGASTEPPDPALVRQANNQVIPA